MSAKSFSSLIEEKLGKVPHFVIYAILEWVMIILLFIDGLLAFISNEFAKFFDLRIPCLFCTRIDHVLVHRNPSFYYNDSICRVHKKDVSSLAYCHMHKRLSDIRSMCEQCLLSYATEKDSDCEKYRSLVGILHKDINLFVEDNAYMKQGKKDEMEQCDDQGGIPRCCCCNEPLKTKPPSKFNRSLSMNGPTPSPRASFLRNEEGRGVGLPPVRFSEPRFTSEVDTELPEEEYVSHAGREYIKATGPVLPDSEDYEEFCKTPSFVRGGNRFFGISLSDSAQESPKWANRGARKQLVDNFFSELNDANSKETDDLVSRLKRQVRLDRKSLIELYMELDEERSASAIAANNAMAMITRLQADKAAVQMEALQYQRMMEEEAEYDREALQLMKDLLLKREEEIKVLESELEAYREKYGHIKKPGSDSVEADVDDNYQEIKSQSVSSFGEKSDRGSSNGADQNENENENECRYERSMEHGDGISDDSHFDFESERSYLLGLLTQLEKKMNATLDDECEDIVEGDAPNQENATKVTFKREVSSIRERLRAIEAESGFLKHTAMTLQRGSEATKLLNEIAQHLRKLRNPNEISFDDKDA